MLCASFVRNCRIAPQGHRGHVAPWSRSSPARAAAVPPYPSEPSEGPGDEKTEEKKKPVFSHALNENFAAEELISELKEKEGFGNRGEVVLLAQLVLAFLVIFPPMQLRGLIFMCGMIIFHSSCCEILWIGKSRRGHIMARLRCIHGLKSAGALALIFGAISTALSFVGLGKSFSPLVTPRKSNVIVSNGMFQYMRHPLYAGLIWLGFGLSAVTYSETRFVMSCLLFLVLNYKAAKEEEAMLLKHGNEYAEYMKQLQRFVPTL